MANPHDPLPPVPAQPPGLSAHTGLDPRWLAQLRARLNASFTSLFINTANGFSGTVTASSVTGQFSVTLSVTAVGLLKGVAGAIASAVPGTDYLQSISVTTPLASTGGGTPTLSIPAATSLAPGHLTASDHALFSSKAPGIAITYTTVADGFVAAFPASSTHLYLVAAAALSSGTVALPASPANSDLATFTCTHYIAVLTNSPNPGQSISNFPSSMLSGSSVTFIYRGSNSTWYRLQ